MKIGCEYSYRPLRCAVLPWKELSAIFAEAAAHLEDEPQYDANWAIAKATDHMPDHVGSMSRFLFRFSFGQVMGDEGVMLLSLAAAMAATGDYPENVRMHPIGP